MKGRCKVGNFTAEVGGKDHYRIWRGRHEGYALYVPKDEFGDFIKIVHNLEALEGREETEIVVCQKCRNDFTVPKEHIDDGNFYACPSCSCDMWDLKNARE